MLRLLRRYEVGRSATRGGLCSRHFIGGPGKMDGGFSGAARDARDDL